MRRHGDLDFFLHVGEVLLAPQVAHVLRADEADAAEMGEHLRLRRVGTVEKAQRASAVLQFLQEDANRPHRADACGLLAERNTLSASTAAAQQFQPIGGVRISAVIPPLLSGMIPMRKIPLRQTLSLVIGREVIGAAGRCSPQVFCR